MAKNTGYNKKNSGPVINARPPIKSPQEGVNTGKRQFHETLGVLSTESPKNNWKPNAGGRE